MPVIAPTRRGFLAILAAVPVLVASIRTRPAPPPAAPARFTLRRSSLGAPLDPPRG